MPLAFAVKMDESAHDQVIQRLEMGVDSMDQSDPERVGILLRLADLYADRARLKAMNAVSQGGDGQVARPDRTKAIQLYNQVMNATSKAEQGRVIVQLAHLYNLNDQATKAVDLYNQVLRAKKSQFSSEVRAIANSTIGDIYFRKGEFKAALNYYEAARRENLKNRALIQFRMAWCYLNLGETEKGTQNLIALLRNPDLMATQSQDGKTADPIFVHDVSNDLSKFLARGPVGAKQIQLVRDLSPDDARKENIHTLVTEADRLGKKAAALSVWAAYVDEGDVTSNEKIEVQARVTQIHFDLNQQDRAAASYEKTMALWREYDCKDEDLCGELKSRLRRIVTSWHKSQKKKPTANLFRIYTAYTNTFSDDVEMFHWAGVIGRDLDRHKEAAQLFRRASILAATALQKDPKNQPMKNIFEGSLLGEIEMAEAGKDLKARESAYNHYLSINPKGEKAFEVRYQRAQVFYQTNRAQEAFSEFHFLASQPGKDHRDLKVKSADLALDALVSMKDDRNLQVRSMEYARIFPERKTEYLKISRKATLNIVAANLKNENSNSRSDYKNNLAALNQVSLEGADDQERIRFLKNKIVIAQKALEFSTVTSAANQLLAVKSLKDEDQEWAMAQKVWAAELQLDFAQAYKLSKQMNFPKLSKADRELRLALLADLAGLNSKTHNENYLRLVKNPRAGNLVRVTLVKNASRPWNELSRHLPELKKTPDLLAGLTLEVFARDRNVAKAEQLLKTTGIHRFPAGRTLARQMEIRDFLAMDRKIRSHKVAGYNEHVMQKTLKERLNLLSQSEKFAKTAFQKHDWTLQMLALSQLARENRRLHDDILNLPVPRRLNKDQRAEYTKMIQAQSEPYMERAEQLDSEIEQIWSSSNSLSNLQSAYMGASPELQKVYRDEISILSLNAPSRAQNRLRDLLSTPYRRPSQKDILMARKAVQADPFSISKAESLRELEAQGGNSTMALYLDERIDQLKKGEQL